MGLFKKRQYITIPTRQELTKRLEVIPDGLWEKCPKCHTILYLPDLSVFKTCSQCQHHFRLRALERIEQICDSNSFQAMDTQLQTTNPLNFNGYIEKINALQQSQNIDEAVVTGFATINGISVALGVMDAHFIMGSMGYVVGEKITRLFEAALHKQLPVILFCASGGARMQEGIHSLMQMAKVSVAVSNHAQANLLYIAYLTDPTMGGVTASFAMQADIILAEPKATIGFAGKRVIEQTIKESVADDFQSAETMQKNGFVDVIVDRQKSKETLNQLLQLHGYTQQTYNGGVHETS